LIDFGSSAAARSYRPDIDGLRALAILSVVFYHGGTAWLPGGFTGVDIFFVISGYLIGGHIFAELRAGDFSYLRFYQRRVKRILPALFAVLAISLLAAMLLLSPEEGAQLARGGCAATLSVSNILFWGTTNYFAGKSELNPLLMTWSLGVEEQFYAVIPLLMVLMAGVRRTWILAATIAVCFISFVFAAILAPRYPMMVFYMLPARMGVGCRRCAGRTRTGTRKQDSVKGSSNDRELRRPGAADCAHVSADGADRVACSFGAVFSSGHSAADCGPVKLDQPQTAVAGAADVRREDFVFVVFVALADAGLHAHCLRGSSAGGCSNVCDCRIVWGCGAVVAFH